jgi:hypothetical protein
LMPNPNLQSMKLRLQKFLVENLSRSRAPTGRFLRAQKMRTGGNGGSGERNLYSDGF